MKKRIAYDYALPAGVACADGDEGGGEYLYRPGELIAAKRDLAQCQETLTRIGQPWKEGSCLRDDSNYARLLVDSRAVPKLVKVLRCTERDDGEGTLDCSPNHVQLGFGHRRPGKSASCPTPTETDLPELPAAEGSPGHGVSVAVLDSGCVATHPWLDGRLLPGSAVETPTSNPSGQLRWCSGHGTFIAGVIAKQAPGAMILVTSVFDDEGTVSDTELADALADVPAAIRLVNLSFGGLAHDDTLATVVQDALAALAARNPGVVVVAAAGNERDDRPVYPAAYDGVVAVAALDADYHGPCFTNYGPWVDACSLGAGARSSFFTDELPVEPVPPLGAPCASAETPAGAQDFQGYATWSGTSFAAPRVVGAIASAMTTFGKSAEEAVELLCGPQHPRYVDGTRDLGVIVPGV